jgi:hypothetical protein
MACLTFNMCDESDTTCIMFIARVIKTLLRWQRRIVHLAPHLDHPDKKGGFREPPSKYLCERAGMLP